MHDDWIARTRARAVKAPKVTDTPTLPFSQTEMQRTNESSLYFSTGDAKPQTARANWSRYLDTVFELAKVDGTHSHRFRDTFAVELLLAGTPLETVSVLLGHSAVRVTERHYKPWVRFACSSPPYAIKCCERSDLAPWPMGRGAGEHHV